MQQYAQRKRQARLTGPLLCFGQVLEMASDFASYLGVRALRDSVVQSRPFDLSVFPFWSMFSHGPKRLTF